MPAISHTNANIVENIDEFVESLSVSRKNALHRWLETEDGDDRISKIKNEMKLLLYNKRNVVLDKEMEKLKVAVSKQKKTKRAKKDSSDNEE